MLKISRTETVILLSIGLITMFAYFVLPSLGLYLDDSGVKYIQMKSFYLHNWKTSDIDYPAVTLDPNLEWVGKQTKLIVRDGHLICTYPPLFMFLSSLFYLRLGDRVTLFLPLVSFFISTIVFLYTLRLIIKPGIYFYLLFFLYVIASPVYLFSITFLEHTPAVLTVSICTYYLTCYFHKKAALRYVFASFLFLSFGVFFRTEIIILLGAYFLAWVIFATINKQSLILIPAIIGAFLPLFAYFSVNFILYGNIFGLHYFYNKPPVTIPLYKVFIMGVALSLSGYYFFKKRTNKNSQRRIFLYFILFWVAYVLIFLRQSAVGTLFMCFPVCLLLILTCFDSESKKLSQDHICFGVFIIFITMMGLFFYGNIHQNVRYFIGVIPFVLVYLAVKEDVITRNKMVFWGVGFLGVISLFSNLYQLKTQILKYKYYNSDRIKFLNEHTNFKEVIIFPVNPLLEHAGPLYFDRFLLIARDGGELLAIIKKLKKENIKTAYYWTWQMDAKGMKKWLNSHPSLCRVVDTSNFAEKYALLKMRIK